MACIEAPCGVGVGEASINSYSIPSQNGNSVHSIPVKVGEPLSASCERATVVGAIPEVFRLPSYTLVAGGAATQKVSNGGFTSVKLANFLNSRVKGCYGDISLYGSTCL